MIEYQTVKEEIIKKTVIKIQCNKCGKEEDGENINDYSTIETHSHSFGYGSDKDMNTYSYELCDKCFDEFINSFKIKADIKGY